MRFSITAGAQDPVNWHVLKKDQWVAVDEESLDLALQSAADGILGNKIAASCGKPSHGDQGQGPEYLLRQLSGPKHDQRRK